MKFSKSVVVCHEREELPKVKVKAFILIKGVEFGGGRYDSLMEFYKGAFAENEYARKVFTHLIQQVNVPDEIYVIRTDDFGSAVNTIILTEYDQRKERVVFFTEP